MVTKLHLHWYVNFLTSSGQVKRLDQRLSSVDVLPFRLLGAELVSEALNFFFDLISLESIIAESSLLPTGAIDGGTWGVLLFIKSSKTPINGPTTLISWLDLGTSFSVSVEFMALLSTATIALDSGDIIFNDAATDANDGNRRWRFLHPWNRLLIASSRSPPCFSCLASISAVLEGDSSEDSRKMEIRHQVAVILCW